VNPLGTLIVGLLIGAALMTFGFVAGNARARQVAESTNRMVENFLRQQREDEPLDAEVVEEPPSLPIDPDNPPFPRRYTRRPGSQPKFCHCHSRQLIDGEDILFWPNPDVEGSFWIVCQEVAR
jgi:hypothetical protein